MTLRFRNRRRLLGVASAALLAGGFARVDAAVALRFGTTPVFLDEQIGLLGNWQRHLESRLKRPVRFVQRGSYREIIDLLLNGGIEVAWLCGYPFVMHEEHMAMVSVPVYQGAPLYRSYLIVPEADRVTQHVSELQGRIFAYSDPGSNSGYLVPRVELLRAGHRPDRFFRRSFFTFGHRRVVEAVQSGLAQAGSVDGYVWDTLGAQQPRSTRGVRVAWRSALFGFPPIVARKSLATADRHAVADALAAMRTNEEGRELLKSLNVDAFATAPEGLFDGIRTLAKEHARIEREPA